MQLVASRRPANYFFFGQRDAANQDLPFAARDAASGWLRQAITRLVDHEPGTEASIAPVLVVVQVVNIGTVGIPSRDATTIQPQS